MVSDSDTTNSKRQRLYIDVSLTLIIAIAILIFSLTRRFINYRIGLEGLAGGTFFGGMVVGTLYPVTWFLVFVLIVRGIILNIRFGIKRLFIQILFTVVSISLVLTLPVFFKGGYTAFTKGFLERMKKEADIPAIQAWVDNIDLETLLNYKVDEYGWWVDESEWPEAVKEFSPDVDALVIKKTKNNKTYVRVLFGDIFVGRYSLTVGVSANEIPLDDYYDSEYRLSLAPIAFVGHRIRH